MTARRRTAIAVALTVLVAVVVHDALAPTRFVHHRSPVTLVVAGLLAARAAGARAARPVARHRPWRRRRRRRRARDARLRARAGRRPGSARGRRRRVQSRRCRDRSGRRTLARRRASACVVESHATTGARLMWWESAVLYQVYPRSYADSNADGVGDLPGLISRLDHLEWLGVDGVWLSPTFPSPNHDWGYDVSDYYDVHPALGTLAEMERLIVEAERRDLRVLLDLVPNDTSDAHPWFHDAEKRDWYVWRDPKPDGSPPNNWKVGVRRRRVDARSGERSVLLAQLPARATRPRLVERGRARGLRRHLAVLVRARGRGLPDRRRACARQGSRAAGQPAAAAERRADGGAALGSGRGTTWGSRRPSTCTGACVASRGSSSPSGCWSARPTSSSSRSS